MSRILEALRKADAERASVAAPLPRAAEARTHAPSPPVPQPETQDEPAPGHAHSRPAAAPAREPSWTAEALPGLPEDFRRELASLRLAVDSALTGRRPRVLLFTSSTSGEGTTTVTASFARVLAQDPAVRVLVVDANLRRPKLALFYGLPPGPGLAEHLHGGLPFEDLVRVVERHNLHVLPALAGDSTGTPVYSQPLLRSFLHQVGVHYDYVLFDAPPVLQSPETIVLGGLVDTSLLVLRAAHTKGGVVNRAVDNLAKAGVPVLGVILNRRRHDIPEFIYKRI